MAISLFSIYVSENKGSKISTMNHPYIYQRPQFIWPLLRSLLKNFQMLVEWPPFHHFGLVSTKPTKKVEGVVGGQTVDKPKGRSEGTDPEKRLQRLRNPLSIV